VRQDVSENVETSTRNRAAHLGLSNRSLCRILYQDLKMYPYKIQITSKLIIGPIVTFELRSHRCKHRQSQTKLFAKNRNEQRSALLAQQRCKQAI